MIPPPTAELIAGDPATSQPEAARGAGRSDAPGLWLARRVGRLLQACGLSTLVLLLPFSKAAVEISFGLLLLGWSLELLLDPAARAHTAWRWARWHTVALAMAAYLLVCVFSMMLSDFPLHSARGLISKWLEYLLFFVIVADIGHRPHVARRGLTLLAWSALCVAAYGAWQELFVRWPPTHPVFWYRRMIGPYDNPIDLATYFIVVIPILTGLWMTSRGWSRWALGGLLLVLIGCLGRTEALGAWLGLCAGIGVVIISERAIRRYGLLLIACLVLVAGGWLQATGRLRPALATPAVGMTDRWMMWRAATGMIRDRPWLGHGVNTFMANYLRYRVGGEPQPRYAHNCYLQVAAETGMLGLTAFLWLLGAIGWRLARGLQQAAGAERTLLLGLGAGLAAFLVQAGLDTNFYALRQAALFWSLAGLALGLSERVQRQPG